MKLTHSGGEVLIFAAKWSEEFDRVRKSLLNCGADLSKIVITTADSTPERKRKKVQKDDARRRIGY